MLDDECLAHHSPFERRGLWQLVPGTAIEHRLAGTRVRVLAADPTEIPIERDCDKVQVLGVLVEAPASQRLTVTSH